MPASFERAGFIPGLEVNANFESREELMDFLKKIFDKYLSFGRILLLFKSYGILSDIHFLEHRLKEADPKKKKEIEKVIITIKSKKKEPIFPEKNKFKWS